MHHGFERQEGVVNYHSEIINDSLSLKETYDYNLKTGYVFDPRPVRIAKYLTPQEKEVYFALNEILRTLPEHFGKLRPTQKTIAKECGMSVKAVSRAVKKLEKKKLISYYRTSAGNVYSMNLLPSISETDALNKSCGPRTKFEDVGLWMDANNKPCLEFNKVVDQEISGECDHLLSFEDTRTIENFAKLVKTNPKLLSSSAILADLLKDSANLTIESRNLTSEISLSIKEFKIENKFKENTTLPSDTSEGSFAPLFPMKEEGELDNTQSSLNQNSLHQNENQNCKENLNINVKSELNTGEVKTPPPAKVNAVKPRKKRRTKAERSLFPGVREAEVVPRSLDHGHVNDEGDVVPVEVEPVFHEGVMEFEQLGGGINYLPQCDNGGQKKLRSHDTCKENAKHVKTKRKDRSVEDGGASSFYIDGTQGDEISAALNGAVVVEDGSNMSKLKNDFESSNQLDEVPSCMVPKPVSKKKAATSYEERQKDKAAEYRKKKYEEGKIRAEEQRARKLGKEPVHGKYSESDMMAIFDRYNMACQKMGYLTQGKMLPRDKTLVAAFLDVINGNLEMALFYAETCVVYYQELAAREIATITKSNLVETPYFNQLFVDWRAGAWLRIINSKSFKEVMSASRESKLGRLARNAKNPKDMNSVMNSGDDELSEARNLMLEKYKKMQSEFESDDGE